jgi:hypothetical protein
MICELHLPTECDDLVVVVVVLTVVVVVVVVVVVITTATTSFCNCVEHLQAITKFWLKQDSNP